MELLEWMRWYQEICLDMGHDPGEDRMAALVLAELLGGVRQAVGQSALRSSIMGQEVVVVGPSLEEGWVAKLSAFEGVFVAADSALPLLLENGFEVCATVTDMDGCLDVLDSVPDGMVWVVHAHGDNIPVLVERIPSLRDPVVGTCQVFPPPPLLNFGGYTDGDRAVLLALAMGARKVKVFGFGGEIVGKPGLGDEHMERKKKKMVWAMKILESERGRGAPIFLV